MNRATLGLAFVVTTVSVGLQVALASTPNSSSLTVPKAPHKTVSAAWTGTVPVSANMATNCSETVGSTLSDVHKIRVTVPAGVYKSVRATMTLTVDSTPTTNGDFIELDDPSGAVIGHDQQKKQMTVAVTNPVAGEYTALVCSFIPDGAPTHNYTAKIAITTQCKAGAGCVIPAAAKGGPAAYHGQVVAGGNPDNEPVNLPTAYHGAPLVLQATNVGRGASEPTIGVDQKGVAFYAASAFDSAIGEAHTIVLRSTDGNRTWSSVQPRVAGQDAHPQNLDPYLFVAKGSRRVFDLDLLGFNSELSFSDDQGATWTTTTVSSLGVNDHQTMVSGVPPAANPSLTPTTQAFRQILYYCANTVGAATCTRSVDGGSTWTPTAAPAFVGYQVDQTQDGAAPASGLCGSLAGHLVTDGKGRLFLPKGNCGNPWLAISDDGAQSWRQVQVDHSGLGVPDIQTAIAADKADNLYYVWWDAKYHLPYLAISRDHGTTWGKPRMIAPPGVREVNFPIIDAGEAGRIAISFPGTTVANQNDEARPWDYYVVVSTDALSANPTFVSNIANPAGDPIHRGACTGRCGGMFDFLDVIVAPTAGGPVWATYVDTCTKLKACNTTSKPGLALDNAGFAVREVSGPALLGPAKSLSRR